jgi:hypothetical protein
MGMEMMMALALALTGLALLMLVLAGLVVVEWFARRHDDHRGGGHVRVTPAERAEALLREHLDDREFRQLSQRGYVDVVSPHDAQRIYRIPSYSGLVRVYEYGIAVRELCVESVEPLPHADTVLMHKLMIQGNELEYLARAHQYLRAGPELRYHP